MADYTWPDSLPRSPLVGTLSVAGQDNDLRSPADIGEGQIRKRASATSLLMTFSVYMTQDQLRILDNFYRQVGGYNRFNFVDPTIQETKEFRFSERYTFNHMQADVFKVDLSLIRKAE